MAVVRKQKGQALVEIALGLPLLLLLLLGIIEGARVAWAYITVQQAAREAARYAVTGRPYFSSDDLDGLSDTEQINFIEESCIGNNSEPDPIEPSVATWYCASEQRIEAIEKIAINTGETLAVSRVCSSATSDNLNADDCNTPGAFRVLIFGQHLNDGTPPEIQTDPNHPGTEGLNVQVNTFYNLQMLTPIFDVIMGGNYITLSGAAQLQNEGLDTAVGIEPPPPIDPLDPNNTCPGCGGGGGATLAEISSLTGYSSIEQTETDFQVRLSNHAEGSYDVYLTNASNGGKICTTAIDATGLRDISCNLSTLTSGLLPPGLYDLFSTRIDELSPKIATAEFQVEIIATTTPTIRFAEGGNVWAVNAAAQIELVAHQGADEPFRLVLYDKNDSQVKVIKTGILATDGPIDWTVDNVAGCNFHREPPDLTPCYLRTLKGDDSIYAELEFYINQPKLVLIPNKSSYAQGEFLRVSLEGHTPSSVYEVFITGGGLDAPLKLGSTLETDQFGDTPYEAEWIVPMSCGAFEGWENGDYDIISRPEGSATTIAKKEKVKFLTPTEPYLTVDGQSPYPAGSTINIRAHLHEPLTEHYLRFDGDKIPTSNASDTFTTSDCGFAVLDYKIPVNTTAGKYLVTSHLYSNNLKQAEIEVDVTTVPIIEVLEGDTVLPDQEITIRLREHEPSTTYRILYAEKTLAELRTNSNGRGQFKYDLSQLPSSPGPDPKAAGNLGKFFDLYSVRLNDITNKVAVTQMALQGADLQVTKIEFPPQNEIAINTTIPMTITVQNIQTVPINSYFDVDLYLNPQPVNPYYYKGYNFPGDVKHWKNSVAPAGQPGDTFTIREEFFVGEYGIQTLHAFADTSNFIVEGEVSGQVANPNNLLDNSFDVRCTAAAKVETFNSLPSGWQEKWYGDANNGSGASISNGQLVLQSDGSSTWQSTDASGGELYYYKTDPITTTAGFDVVVQVLDVQRVGSWSKAGIEIRNSVNDTRSPRVVLGVARENGGSNYIVQPAYRDGGGMNWASPGDTIISNNTRFQLSDGPMWLRIERVPGSNEFNFYRRQDTATPPTAPAAAASWWGSPFANATLSNISDQLYVGLFNSPYRNGGPGTSKLDNFSVFDPTACEAAQGPADDNDLPAGLTLCSDPIEDKSFELSPSKWTVAFGEGVTRSAGQANSGNFKLSASSFSGFPTKPWFRQQFIMPDWVISTTTSFELSLSRNINTLASGNQPNDKFYAIVTTNPSSIAAAKAGSVTTPTVVAEGTMPPGAYNPTRWNPINVTLPIKDKSTIESYAEKTLYLYLYNDSNSTGACGTACSTDFYFDDVSLAPCTSQPLPDPINTRLTGAVTLNFSDGSTKKLPYVKVWAYAQNDPTVYETMTLQDGTFNFYNLPAAAEEGTQYLIFAQYNLVDAADPTQIETLSADTSILMRVVHTNDKPQRVSLD
ncbi:MAG: pilus assembly protein, partial [Anaerolineae bacterium]|nr:pilus assembly protein [Anaerolineae bacterium]